MKKLLLIVAFILVPGVALACPQIALNGAQIRASGQALYNPQAYAVVAGGTEDLTNCNIRNLTDGAPEGFVAQAPDFELTYQGSGYALEFRVESECDTVLLINTGAANWYWDDDDNLESPLDARIRLTRASNGVYDIWIGTIGQDNCNAKLILETF